MGWNGRRRRRYIIYFHLRKWSTLHFTWGMVVILSALTFKCPSAVSSSPWLLVVCMNSPYTSVDQLPTQLALSRSSHVATSPIVSLFSSSFTCRYSEAMKFAFARRSFLGDSEFVDVRQTVANLTSHQFGDYLRG